MRVIQFLVVVTTLAVGAGARYYHGTIKDELYRCNGMESDSSYGPLDFHFGRSSSKSSNEAYVAPQRVAPSDVQENPYLK